MRVKTRQLCKCATGLKCRRRSRERFRNVTSKWSDRENDENKNTSTKRETHKSTWKRKNDDETSGGEDKTVQTCDWLPTRAGRRKRTEATRQDSQQSYRNAKMLFAYLVPVVAGTGIFPATTGFSSSNFSFMVPAFGPFIDRSAISRSAQTHTALNTPARPSEPL